MSENKETLPEGSQPKGENPEGDKSGGDNVSDSISLEDLNKTLGKEFKDVETAKKSLQDTQSYVGKKIEEAEPKEDPSVKEQLVNLQSQLNDSNFYRDNPMYDNKETRELIKELGGDPTEVVERDVFKTTFEKTSAYDKSQESKSVLHNSSRLGQVTTGIDEANTAMDKANKAASSGDVNEALRQKDKAEEQAVKSVIDSMTK